MQSILNKLSKDELKHIVENSYSYKEVLTKIGYKTTSGRNNETLKKKLLKYNISVAHFTSTCPTVRNYNDVFCINSTVSQSVLRSWTLKENVLSYKCNICGLEPEWNGALLTLQLDHINGINNDNRLNNLRWLCPNCHSQTKTFCGKGIKKACSTKNGVRIKSDAEKIKYCVDCGREISIESTRCLNCASILKRKIKHPSKEELKDMLINNCGNFTEISKIYGVRDNTIRKWCKSYNIPYHSYDYKIPKEKEIQYIYPVQQIDKKTGELIATYNSIKNAEDVTGICHITEASDKNNTSRKSAGGYLWERLTPILRTNK